MTADPPPEPPKLHPAVAVPLLPFVLVYEGLRWVGRAVTAGLPPVGRFLAWVLTPLRVLAEAVGGVLAWIGHGCRRVLAGVRDVVAPAVRLLTAPLYWLGRRVSRLLWKLDHGVAWLWQQTSTGRPGGQTGQPCGPHLRRVRTTYLPPLSEDLLRAGGTTRARSSGSACRPCPAPPGTA